MSSQTRKGNHCLNRNLLDKVPNLFENGGIDGKYGFLSDFTIKAKTGEEIRCFKFVLALQSDVFCDMFGNFPHEVSYQDERYEYRHLKMLFEAPLRRRAESYKVGEPYEVSDLLQLLQMTDFYGMVDELNLIQDTIGNMTTKDNVLDIVNFIDMYVPLLIIKPTFQDKLKKVIFKNVDLNIVSPLFLENILKLDCPNQKFCPYIREFELAHFIHHDRFQYDDWSVHGMIRRVKTKFHKSDSQLKGLEVELQDGTVHSICMDEDDETKTVELIVPYGDHITKAFFHERRNDDALHYFGLKTSGPHNEPTMFSSGCECKTYLYSKHHSGCKLDTCRMIKVGCSKYHYLSGLSGKTYKVANGTIKMATLAFHFVTEDTHDICKSED